MSTQHGHASNLKSGRPNAPLNVAGQGGRPKTMFLGMAAVAAGLGAFWLLQFNVQNRSHNSNNPAEMPTWQFRHAQQMPEFKARMSTPGGTDTLVHNSKESTQHKATNPADTKGSGGGAASSGMVQAQASGDTGRGLESGGSSDHGGEDRFKSADPRGTDNHVQRKDEDGGSSRKGDVGVVASVLTALHGESKSDQNHDNQVTQPAPVRRLNDRGGMYTKNSDYKDGYRRD